MGWLYSTWGNSKISSPSVSGQTWFSRDPRQHLEGRVPMPFITNTQREKTFFINKWMCNLRDHFSVWRAMLERIFRKMMTAITYKQNILAERLLGGLWSAQKWQTMIFCQWKNNQNVSTFASGVQPQMYIGNMQTSEKDVCFNNDGF